MKSLLAGVLARMVLRIEAKATHIIAIGKAAPAMLASVNAPNAKVLAVVPDGLGLRGALLAGHPLPDARSVVAAERCLAFAAEAESLLVLVSGGASALVCAPAGITLAKKRAVTRAMLESGARIQDINIVRKHLSRIKGGGLARAAKGPVRTFVLSDVIGGTASDVGSGPSVTDTSTVAMARRLVHRWAPAFDLPFVPTGPAKNALAARIVGSPEDMARAAASELRARGYRVKVLPPSQADVSVLAREYTKTKLGPRSAIVRAAEPSVAVLGKGRGGRSTHLAALVGRDLAAGYGFLAAATDGVDGSSGTGGAFVEAGFASAKRIDEALERFATGALHRGAGTALRERATGQNFADLHVLLRRAD